MPVSSTDRTYCLSSGFAGNSDITFFGELHGIVEQIEKNLFEAALIRSRLADVFGDFQSQVNALLFGKGLINLTIFKIEAGKSKREGESDNWPASILEISSTSFNQSQQMAGAGLHHAHLLLLFLVERSGQTLEQDAGEADDGVQGGAQFRGSW
jgi:hypothetical protein